jgi:broad specificity phosphatase PhoE
MISIASSSRLAVVTVLMVLASSTAFAQKNKNGGENTSYPAHILIIRHAEKPPDGDRSLDLAAAGAARAKALPQLFTASATRPNPLPRPDFIFATQDTRHSHRPVDTATPLGATLGVRIDTEFADNDVRALAHELRSRRKYEGKTVLIVWHQGTIPDLAKALGATAAPAKWKDSVFDRVWEITYGKNGTVSFDNLPQHLMSGDSVK